MTRRLGLTLALMLTVAPAVRTAPAPAPEAGAAPPADAWFDQVRRDLAEQEYRVSWQGSPAVPEIEPAWQAPNRAHGFRTYFTPEGIRVVPRTGATPTWRWGLSFVGYGRGDQEGSAVTRAEVAPSGRRVEYRRGAIAEFYENREDGLEQGFVIPAPPGGAGAARGVNADARPVRIDLALWGDLTPRIAEDGQAVDFVTASGAPAVHYAQLKVTDARGTTLRSWMEGFVGERASGIRLVFDDRDAIYPVTIDPLATSPAWTVVGHNAQGRLGMGAATAGDVNGDGHSDVIVGADGYDLAYADAGKASLYLGSASGLSTTPSWTVGGEMPYAYFGTSVGTAGDVNGDGYSDVIVGAPGHSNGEQFEGRAYVYLGSSGGLALGPAWFAEGEQAQGQFGQNVATAGDVNADGCSDVIVGARNYDNVNLTAGLARVYLGSPSGLAATPAWSVEGDRPSARLGQSVSTAGDVNGDGYADIVVGAPTYNDDGNSIRGRAYLYHGTASGPSPVAAWSMDGEGSTSNFGESVGTAGDVNGDGYSDVVVGAPSYQIPGQPGKVGRVTLYTGSAAGLSTTASASLDGSQVDALFGESVSTAGDINGDGFADVIVAAPYFTFDQTHEGRVTAYLGSALGLVATPFWTVDGDQAMAGNDFGFGSLVGPAGDVNGDGYADVVVSSPWHDTTAANGGKVSVYLGSPSGPAIAPGWIASSDQGLADFGWSLGTAGDVNGDGFADVIVGAMSYDNGETDEGLARVYLGSAAGLETTPAWTAEGNQASARFGGSVASAGDLNGDGYSDIVVGAHLHDNGETDEGRVYVYPGSAAGLSPSPIWTGEGDQEGAQYGFQVAPAGDVDGDGCGEFLVGAPRYDAGQTDEGRVYLYEGSSLGPPFTPRTFESNQAGARYGNSVATAGDVNRDGYTDVLIGAEMFDNGQNNEGRAYLHLGSVTGLISTPAWIAENDEISSFMGSAVATAGDVNGDGYADVLIGARGHDGIWGDQGRAYLYQGMATGLAAAPSWTMDLVQDGTGLGTALGTAGDVNGDGFADVIIGASGYSNELTDEGAAFLYLGSASGLSGAPAWTKEGDTGFHYGNAVGTAGDVNGDGYADIIVGAYFFAGTSGLPEGKAFVHYGNGGGGLSLRPRQLRADDLGPIAPGGRSRLPQFRLAASGGTPFGRGRVHLEWEVKPAGLNFDGTGLARSVAPVDTGAGAGGAPFNELVTGLQPGPNHWRMRLLYDGATIPFARHSRWFTVPWNGWNEADLNASVIVGGVVWADIDHDGLREPGEPMVANTPVYLLNSAGGALTATLTGEDGRYDFEVPHAGAHHVEFQPWCYAMTTPDQGVDDALDSDADPLTQRTGLIGPTFAEGDDTRWSAGVVGVGGLDPIALPVTITGARPYDPVPGWLTFDLSDPNPWVNVSGYNLYRSTSAALPLTGWERLWTDHPDEDGTMPGVQISVFGDPPIGSVFFFQVTATNSACGIEGPR